MPYILTNAQTAATAKIFNESDDSIENDVMSSPAIMSKIPQQRKTKSFHV